MRIKENQIENVIFWTFFECNKRPLLKNVLSWLFEHYGNVTLDCSLNVLKQK